MPGSRSGSVMRGSKRSAFRRICCKAFPRHSAPEWRPAREQLRDVGVNASEQLGLPVRHGPGPYRAYRLQRHRGKVAPRSRRCARAGDRLVRRHDHPHADFGAQPGSLNSLGYKDGIGQPAIAGSGVAPLPGQGQPIKAGEFILGYPGEADFAYPIPQPDVLGRNGTYVGFRKYQSRVGTFNRFLQANASTRRRAGTACGQAGRPLAQRGAADACPGRGRPGARRRPSAQQRLQLFGRRAWPAGTVRLPYSPHEPARHALTQLTDVNLHRIIRRATTYGAPYDPNALSEADDEVPRGVDFPLHQRQGDGHDRIPATENGSTTATLRVLGDERDPMVGLQPEARPLPFRRRRSGAAFTASRLSTFFAAVSIFSCRACRHCGGSPNFLDGPLWQPRCREQA